MSPLVVPTLPARFGCLRPLVPEDAPSLQRSAIKNGEVIDRVLWALLRPVAATPVQASIDP